MRPPGYEMPLAVALFWGLFFGHELRWRGALDG